jgi:hypothetical protein
MVYGIVHHFAGGSEEQYRASIAAVHPNGAPLRGKSALCWDGLPDRTDRLLGSAVFDMARVFGRARLPSQPDRL